MKLFFRYSLFSLVLFYASCVKQDIDQTPPTLSILQTTPVAIQGMVCGSLEDNVLFAQSGDSLLFELELSDDTELAQYKLDIHNNFDCHGHRSTSDWSYIDIVDISGNTHTATAVLVVPTDVTAGNYHCGWSLLDASGNQSPSQYLTLSLQNADDTLAPSLQLTQPTTSSLTINKGDSLQLVGTLSDNKDLSDGRLELIYFTPSGNRVTATNINIPSNSGNSFGFDIRYEIPQTLVSGSYDFELRAYDSVGNTATAYEIAVQIN